MNKAASSYSESINSLQALLLNDENHSKNAAANNSTKPNRSSKNNDKGKEAAATTKKEREEEKLLEYHLELKLVAKTKAVPQSTASTASQNNNNNKKQNDNMDSEILNLYADKNPENQKEEKIEILVPMRNDRDVMDALAQAEDARDAAEFEQALQQMFERDILGVESDEDEDNEDRDQSDDDEDEGDDDQDGAASEQLLQQQDNKNRNSKNNNNEQLVTLASAASFSSSAFSGDNENTQYYSNKKRKLTAVEKAKDRANHTKQILDQALDLADEVDAASLIIHSVVQNQQQKKSSTSNSKRNFYNTRVSPMLKLLYRDIETRQWRFDTEKAILMRKEQILEEERKMREQGRAVGAMKRFNSNAAKSLQQTNNNDALLTTTTTSPAKKERREGDDNDAENQNNDNQDDDRESKEKSLLLESLQLSSQGLSDQNATAATIALQNRRKTNLRKRSNTVKKPQPQLLTEEQKAENELLGHIPRKNDDLTALLMTDDDEGDDQNLNNNNMDEQNDDDGEENYEQEINNNNNEEMDEDENETTFNRLPDDDDCEGGGDSLSVTRRNNHNNIMNNNSFSPSSLSVGGAGSPLSLLAGPLRRGATGATAAASERRLGRMAKKHEEEERKKREKAKGVFTKLHDELEAFDQEPRKDSNPRIQLIVDQFSHKLKQAEEKDKRASGLPHHNGQSKSKNKNDNHNNNNDPRYMKGTSSPVRALESFTALQEVDKLFKKAHRNFEIGKMSPGTRLSQSPAFVVGADVEVSRDEYLQHLVEDKRKQVEMHAQFATDDPLSSPSHKGSHIRRLQELTRARNLQDTRFRKKLQKLQQDMIQQGKRITSTSLSASREEEQEKVEKIEPRFSRNENSQENNNTNNIIQHHEYEKEEYHPENASSKVVDVGGTKKNRRQKSAGSEQNGIDDGDDEDESAIRSVGNGTSMEGEAGPSQVVVEFRKRNKMAFGRKAAVNEPLSTYVFSGNYPKTAKKDNNSNHHQKLPPLKSKASHNAYLSEEAKKEQEQLAQEQKTLYFENPFAPVPSAGVEEEDDKKTSSSTTKPKAVANSRRLAPSTPTPQIAKKKSNSKITTEINSVTSATAAVGRSTPAPMNQERPRFFEIFNQKLSRKITR